MVGGLGIATGAVAAPAHAGVELGFSITASADNSTELNLTVALDGNQTLSVGSGGGGADPNTTVVNTTTETTTIPGPPEAENLLPPGATGDPSETGLPPGFLRGGNGVLPQEGLEVALPSPEMTTVATGAGIGVILAMAFAEFYRYRFIFPFLPLFSRIPKGDLLDNQVRRTIFEYIGTHPGVHFNGLRKALSLSNGTAMFHLACLQRAGLISSRRVRGRRVFFVGAANEGLDPRRFLSPLQSMIFEHLGAKPGISQRTIAKDLSLKATRVNYNVRVLARAGLVKVERRGRRTLCYPTKPPPKADAEATTSSP
jgi:DNA-binding MarR family transcriptional regulator